MADAIAPIGMKISADLSDWSPKIRTAGDDVSTFAQRSKQSLEGVSNAMAATREHSAGMFSAIGQGAAGSSFSAATSQLEGFLSKLASGPGLFTALATSAIAAMGSIGVAVSRTASQIGDLNKMSRILGTDSTDTQVLMRVFAGAGMDEETSRSALLKFSSHLGAAANNDSGAEAESFHGIGLDPSQMQNRGMVNALQQTIEALRQIPNRFQQDAAAQGIFGRRFADLESIIQRPGAFERARESVGVSGVSSDVAARARGTAAFRLETEDIVTRSGGTMFNRLGQLWNSAATNIDRNWATVERWMRTGDVFSDVRHHGGGQRTPTPLDRYTPDDESKADKDAKKLAEKWATDATLFTHSAHASQLLRGERGGASEAELRRTAEILKAQADGVAAANIAQLEVQNRILSAMERRAAVEVNAVALAERTRTALEGFWNTWREGERILDHFMPMRHDEGFTPILPGGIEARNAVDRNRANSFRALERTLGNGPSSYALSGVDPRTMEGARYLADLETRGRIDNQQDRVRLVMEAIRDINQRELEEIFMINRGIAELVRNPLAPAVPAPEFRPPLPAPDVN